MDVSYSLNLKIHDEEALRRQAFVSDPDLEGDATIEQIIRAVLVDPAEPPLDAGYEILNASVFNEGEGNFRVNVIANVIDEDLLSKAASEAYERAWGEKGWTAGSTEEALYEHVFGSNAQPPSLDIGFEIMWSDVDQSPAVPVV